jgi:hypothetical protein
MTDLQNITRRTLLGKLGIGAAAAALLPATASADTPIQSAPVSEIDNLPYDEQLWLESYRTICAGGDEDRRFRIVHAAQFLALCEIHGVADGVSLNAGYSMEHLEKRAELFDLAEQVTGGFLGAGGPGAERWEVADLERRISA